MQTGMGQRRGMCTRAFTWIVHSSSEVPKLFLAAFCGVFVACGLTEVEAAAHAWACAAKSKADKRLEGRVKRKREGSMDLRAVRIGRERAAWESKLMRIRT